MFIDRVPETIFLREDFLKYSSLSRFLIVAGDTGRGKSELINRAFTEYDLFVRVKIAKHEGVKNIPSMFIKELAKGLNHLSFTTATVTDFEKHFKDEERSFFSSFKNVISDIVENNAFASSKELGKIIRDIKSKRDLLNTVFSSDHSEAFTIACSYIKSMISRQRFIITLENVQNIDKESLVFFRDLLTGNPALYVIGEYTSGADFQIGLYDLQNYFASKYITSSIIELEMLPLDEIIAECREKPEIIRSILKNSYEESSGNLHHLQILMTNSFSSSVSSNTESIKYESIISKELENLDTESRFLISCVVAHGGSVDREILNIFMLANYNTYALSTATTIKEKIELLVEKKLLKENFSNVNTAQDSIIDKLTSNQIYRKYLLISYKAWLSFYQKLGNSSVDFLLPESEILSWQILFKAFLEDLSGMNELLDNVYKMSLLSIAPKRAIRYLEKIKSILSRTSENKRRYYRDIDFKIVQILYRFRYFEEIPSYTTAHLDNHSLFLLHISSLAMIGRAEEAIGLANEYINTHGKDFALDVLIVRITAYRASNRYEECEAEWINAYNTGVFNGTQYEAIFLRCADFSLMSDYHTRMECLNKATEIFAKNSDVLNEISARIALSLQYGYDGEFDKAVEELNIANSKSKIMFTKHYVIENNYSVIDLQKGEANNDLINKLQQASITCETAIDRFIILNNLFIAQSMQGVPESEQTLRILEQKIYKNEIADYDLKRIAFFNAHIHYLKVKNYDLCNYYLSSAKSLPVLSDNDFWDYKLHGKRNSDYDDFRYSIDYYPVYITFWHFDFDMLRESS